MNTHYQTGRGEGRPTDSDYAEAAAWIAKLHNRRRNKELETGLRRWLDESPDHREAFEQATQLWTAAESFPKAEMPLRELLDVRPESKWKPLAIAASLVLATFTTIVAYRSYMAPTYTTDIGEQRNVTLGDGTRIALNTDTQLKVRYDKAARNIELLRGEALFDIAQDPTRPLTVTAGNRQIKALGTAFLIRYDSAQTSVTLVDGKVAVTRERKESTQVSKVAQAVVLTPGQRIIFYPSPGDGRGRRHAVGGEGNGPVTGLIQTRKAPTGDADTDLGYPETIIDRPAIDKITAWQRGQIVFDHTALADAIAEINRYSKTQITLHPATGEGADIQITGIFRAGDTEYFAQALAETHNLTLTHQGSTITLNPP